MQREAAGVSSRIQEKSGCEMAGETSVSMAGVPRKEEEKESIINVNQEATVPEMWEAVEERQLVFL